MLEPPWQQQGVPDVTTWSCVDFLREGTPAAMHKSKESVLGSNPVEAAHLRW
jgi:hypothetical protein